MTTKDEALKLALEALEQSHPEAYRHTITAIREALAEQPAPVQQEPVAWSVINPAGEIVATEKDAIHGWARLGGFKPTLEGLLGFHDQGWRVVPSISPQPSKPWVGLTDEEIDECYYWKDRKWTTDELVRYVEAKLREKNA